MYGNVGIVGSVCIKKRLPKLWRGVRPILNHCAIMQGGSFAHGALPEGSGLGPLLRTALRMYWTVTGSGGNGSFGGAPRASGRSYRGRKLQI